MNNDNDSLRKEIQSIKERLGKVEQTTDALIEIPLSSILSKIKTLEQKVKKLEEGGE